MSSELETCLTKAISEFKVRDMLTKFGLPEDAEVTLKLQLSNNSKPIASCIVPTTVKQDNVKCGSLSLNKFEKSIKDQFINPAFEKYNLNTYMPSDTGEAFAEGNMSLNIGFDSTYSHINGVSISAYCCRRCPPPNNHLCCLIC